VIVEIIDMKNQSKAVKSHKTIASYSLDKLEAKVYTEPMEGYILTSKI